MDELISHITKVDWPKLGHFGGVSSFGNENNVCFIYCCHGKVLVENIKHHVGNICSYNAPIFMKKDS